ncbi:MAG: hypothetical protein A2X04_09785 [Bacteroidetes bacterium GWF2_41_9]|nr:MAG: hypothetical protein A2X03_12400 [Bacteroidetes bacterium GWA2_40_15]OFY59172.1 MAG: hypothetical protein A2X04_09785 [Bacteroidetes bacterium GWF2_41_9]
MTGSEPIFNKIKTSICNIFRFTRLHKHPTFATSCAKSSTDKVGIRQFKPGTWNLEPGTWNLEPEIWNLKP